MQKAQGTTHRYRRHAHQSQLNGEAHFHNDLGLDSLDTVEVVMAIEEVSRNESQ